MSVFPEFDNVILIVGEIASGKTTISQNIASSLNYSYISISDYLKDTLKKKGKDINRQNLQSIGEKLFKEKGEEYIILGTLEIIKNRSTNCVIDGIRYMEGVKILKDHYGNKCILVFIDKSEELRRKRFIDRADGDKWENITKSFTEANITKLKPLSDIIISGDIPSEQISLDIVRYLASIRKLMSYDFQDYMFEKKNDLRVICFGQLTEDHYCFVERMPPNNQFANVTKEIITYGGNAANSAYCFAKLGCNTSLYSQTSEYYPVKLFNMLKKDSVNTGLIDKRLKSHPKCFMYFKDEKSSNFYHFDDKYNNVKIDINLSFYNIILISGTVEITEIAFDIIESQNVKALVCWSPGYETRFLPFQLIKRIINFVNVLIVNEFEYSFLTNLFNKKIEGKNLKVIVKTLGDRGSILISEKYTIKMPSLNMKVKNTYGAGDFFAAALTYSFYLEQDAINSLEFATKMTYYPLNSWSSR
ncbi:MAG: AAA family ATPase [Ignavibacteriales bacterium]|nr:AAA family ATPase [Ignavibacteriales bacterium]